MPCTTARWSSTRGHDLALLFERLGLQLEPQERDLLQTLTRFVMHLGRYPTPLSLEEPRSFKVDQETMTVLERLWKKLMDEFLKERAKRRAARNAST